MSLSDVQLFCFCRLFSISWVLPDADLQFGVPPMASGHSAPQHQRSPASPSLLQRSSPPAKGNSPPSKGASPGERTQWIPTRTDWRLGHQGSTSSAGWFKRVKTFAIFRQRAELTPVRLKQNSRPTLSRTTFHSWQVRQCLSTTKKECAQ